MAQSTFAPGAAVRAFLTATNPFAPEPQALLKALALLLAAPATAADEEEEEEEEEGASSSFRNKLLGGIAAAVEDFAYDRLLEAVAAAAAAAAAAGAAGEEAGAALDGLVQALTRCDLLAHHEAPPKQGQGQGQGTQPAQAEECASGPVPLSRLLLDATRAAWRRLSRAQALRLALLLAQATDAAMDPYAAASSSGAVAAAAASWWRERVSALGAVVGRVGCGRDMLYFHERLLARRLLQGRTRGAEAEAWALEALGLLSVRADMRGYMRASTPSFKDTTAVSSAPVLST
jgi:hypothetical protein